MPRGVVWYLAGSPVMPLLSGLPRDLEPRPLPARHAPATGPEEGALLPSAYPAFAKYFVQFVQKYEAAGVPIFAVENREDVIPVRPEWLAARGGDVFALRVRGDSMIEAHIADGDLVLVMCSPRACCLARAIG